MVCNIHDRPLYIWGRITIDPLDFCARAFISDFCLVFKVQLALRNIQSIGEYPVRMQRKIVEMGRYEKYVHSKYVKYEKYVHSNYVKYEKYVQSNYVTGCLCRLKHCIRFDSNLFLLIV